MTTSKYAINEKHIECSLCLSAFEDPRILPCGHTFCLQCITTQVAISSSKSTDVLCSMCCQVCALPEGDAGKLTKTYALAAVTSEAKQETSPVMLDAAVNTVVAVDAVDLKFFCKKHTDQKIEVYCKDCRVLACALCGLLSHTKHTFIEADEADKEFKKVISVAAEKCKKTIGLATRNESLTGYDKRLLEKHAQLAAEESRLARYKALLNSKHASFIERESAVKTLQLNQQLQTSRPQQRVVKLRRGGPFGPFGVVNRDYEYDDYNDYNDYNDYRDSRGCRGYNDYND